MNAFETLRPLFVIGSVLLAADTSLADDSAVREFRVPGPNGMTIAVRMQGPYDADVTLQVVCFFKWTPDAIKRSSGAPIELDRRLGGLITSLRSRGEFVGDDLETLLIESPAGTIKPKRLLLAGLGEESTLSLAKLERIGAASLRSAVQISATQVAFAPLLRDQGNSKFAAKDVEIAVTKGMLLAYDSERRLQRQGFAKPFGLQTWVVEAGPLFYDETILGVKSGVEQAKTAIDARDAKPYSTKSKQP